MLLETDEAVAQWASCPAKHVGSSSLWDPPQTLVSFCLLGLNTTRRGTGPMYGIAKPCRLNTVTPRKGSSPSNGCRLNGPSKANRVPNTGDMCDVPCLFLFKPIQKWHPVGFSATNQSGENTTPGQNNQFGELVAG